MLSTFLSCTVDNLPESMASHVVLVSLSLSVAAGNCSYHPRHPHLPPECLCLLLPQPEHRVRSGRGCGLVDQHLGEGSLWGRPGAQHVMGATSHSPPSTTHLIGPDWSCTVFVFYMPHPLQQVSWWSTLKKAPSKASMFTMEGGNWMNWNLLFVCKRYLTSRLPANGDYNHCVYFAYFEMRSFSFICFLSSLTVWSGETMPRLHSENNKAIDYSKSTWCLARKRLKPTMLLSFSFQSNLSGGNGIYERSSLWYHAVLFLTNSNM